METRVEKWTGVDIQWKWKHLYWLFEEVFPACLNSVRCTSVSSCRWVWWIEKSKSFSTSVKGTEIKHLPTQRIYPRSHSFELLTSRIQRNTFLACSVRKCAFWSICVELRWILMENMWQLTEVSYSVWRCAFPSKWFKFC